MGNIVTKEESRCISIENTFEDTSTIQYIPKSYQENFQNVMKLEEKEPIEYKKEYNTISLPDEEQFYWTKRVESLQNEHQEINKILQSQYDITMENTKNLYNPKLSTQEKMAKIKPCLDWRFKISKCYEDNYHQPLVCSKLVQEFVSSVASVTSEDEN